MSPLASRTVWFIVLLLAFIILALTIVRQVGYQQGGRRNPEKPVRIQGRMTWTPPGQTGEVQSTVVIEGVIIESRPEVK